MAENCFSEVSTERDEIGLGRHPARHLVPHDPWLPIRCHRRLRQRLYQRRVARTSIRHWPALPSAAAGCGLLRLRVIARVRSTGLQIAAPGRPRTRALRWPGRILCSSSSPAAHSGGHTTNEVATLDTQGTCLSGLHPSSDQESGNAQLKRKTGGWGARLARTKRCAAARRLFANSRSAASRRSIAIRCSIAS